MGSPSNAPWPNVFSERLAGTLHGSTLVVKNTFIDIEGDQQECVDRHSSHERTRSLPPSWNGTHECNSGRKRAETYIELRRRLLSTNSDESDQCQMAAVDSNADNSVLASEQIWTPASATSSPVRQSAFRTSSIISEASSYSGTAIAGSMENHMAGQDGTLSSSCGGSTVDSTEVPLDSPQLQFAPDASIRDETKLRGECTTVILRGVPPEYTRGMLLDTLNCNGFFGHLDFLYLPIDFGTNTTFGHAFINFASGELAARFMFGFRGFSNWSVPSCSKASVEWSDGRQGLDGQIERYRNSAMMHSSVSDEARPILLCDGIRVAFPGPTQTLKPLRVRAWKKNASSCLQAQAVCSYEQNSQHILLLANEVTSASTCGGNHFVASCPTTTSVRRSRRRR